MELSIRLCRLDDFCLLHSQSQLSYLLWAGYTPEVHLQ